MEHLQDAKEKGAPVHNKRTEQGASLRVRSKGQKRAERSKDATAYSLKHLYLDRAPIQEIKDKYIHSSSTFGGF